MKFATSLPLLMLIDLQKAIDDPSWGQRNNPEAENQIERILATWRAMNLPILHIKHMSNEPNSTYYPGTQGNEFKDQTKPLEDEEVLEKSTNSAFIRTSLDDTLQERNITEIVIVGVVTNNSVEASARMAGNLGYRTIVVSDATFTFNLVDYSGQEHSAGVIHNISLANLKDEYATILTTKEILACAHELN